MDAHELKLKELSEKDQERINAWPPYPPEYAKLDYALRTGGWLDMFPARSSNARYGLWLKGRLVGFTLLVNMDHGKAEFYIAIHPGHLGGGLGSVATRLTLEKAFGSLGLQQVYLKVRVWHRAGIHVYAKQGFKPAGTTVETIQGEPVDFLRMEVDRDEFAALARKRGHH